MSRATNMPIASIIPFPTTTPASITAIDSFPATITAVPSVITDTRIAELTEKIHSDQPKVKLANAIAASSTSFTINELAKVLKQNGVNIGQNRLYSKLRSDGYLCKRNSIRNIPTQSAMNRGFFEVREMPYSTWKSSQKTNRSVLVTGKGLNHLINRYLPDNEARTT